MKPEREPVFLFLVSCFWFLVFSVHLQGYDRQISLQAVEKEMAEKPEDALAIARRVADQFADANDRKRFLASAARLQKSQLKNLTEVQAADLAKTFETDLSDGQAALQVRLSWLKQRAKTQEEVRRLLGPPGRISWQVLYRHQIEQWIYEDPAPLRINFDCAKGLEPQLVNVHSLKSTDR
jgi:hypothetical protein